MRPPRTPTDSFPCSIRMPDSRERIEYFDGLYRARAEPWDYSRSAAEILRHEHVVRTAGSLAPRFARVLDVGCSLGQLTCRFLGLADELHGIDLSPAAAAAARRRCRETADPRASATRLHFYAGGVPDLPFRPAAFDLALLCDGLVSWRLTPEEQMAALEQVSGLVPDGWVILTDALKPAQLEMFVERVRSSPLEIVSIRYLNDRLWYSVERATRAIQHWPAVRRVLASRSVARALSGFSALAGRRGTKHVCIVARGQRS